MPSKLLRSRTATVVALALLSIGATAAAASGLASAAAERAPPRRRRRRARRPGRAHEIGDAAAKTHGPNAAAVTNSSGKAKPSDHVCWSGPSGSAKHGLC